MRLALFIVLLVVASLPWWWLARETGFFAFTLFLMWSPALAAFGALRLTGGALESLGWSPGKLKYWIGG